MLSRSYRILATDYDGFTIEYTCQNNAGKAGGDKDGTEFSYVCAIYTCWQ